MGSAALRIIVVLVFVFLLAPLCAVVLASFSTGAPLAFPPPGLTVAWYGAIAPDMASALWTSLMVGAGATLLSTVMGTLAALALQRGRLPGRRVLAALCLSPLMVPTLVIGVAGFQFALLLWDMFGITLADTKLGIILGHAAFGIPFVIRSATAAQAEYDMSLEEAARNLGASPVQTFLRVTLPMLAPGIAAGAIFAFLASFDDVPVALFMGGADTVTLPVRIFTSIEFSFDASVMAVSALVILGSMILMLVVDRLVGLDRVLGPGRA